MGFSRGLLNVVSFGAASRVDKAGREYQDMVNTHNFLAGVIRQGQEDIKRFLEEEKAWVRFKEKNKQVLERLYRHNTHLSEEQQHALKVLEEEKSNLQRTLGGMAAMQQVYEGALNKADLTFEERKDLLNQFSTVILTLAGC